MMQLLPVNSCPVAALAYLFLDPYSNAMWQFAAATYLMNVFDAPCVEQDALCGGGLARVDVRRDANVAYVTQHLLLFLCDLSQRMLLPHKLQHLGKTT